MKFTLDLKPLSVNAAFQGRRYNTPAKNQFERACALLIPKPQRTFKGWVRVEYRFFLKNFSRTDVGNCEKVLTDCMVKRGIISDDRKIIDLRLLKFTSEKDKIEIEISEDFEPIPSDDKTA